jgi:hypothetical protein
MAVLGSKILVFHTMENFPASFPQYGKLFEDFSTVWKTFSKVGCGPRLALVPKRDLPAAIRARSARFPRNGKLYPHGRKPAEKARFQRV